MFPRSYFAAHYFAPFYFPQSSGAAPVIPPVVPVVPVVTPGPGVSGGGRVSRRIPLPPARDPFFIYENVYDRTGKVTEKRVTGITRPWLAFFQGLFEGSSTAQNLERDPGDNTQRRDVSREIDEGILGQFHESTRGGDIATAREAAEAAQFARVEVGRIAREIDELRSEIPVLPHIRPGSDLQSFVGTHAARAGFPAAAYPDGSRYYETDRKVSYVVVSAVWTYASGVMRNTLANMPTDLGTGDVGFLFDVSDYSHVLQWTGAAWTWGPGDTGSGYYQLFEAAPSGYGANAWQISDGSTVARLNSDGTTTNVALFDLTTPAYLKGGLGSSAPAAASGLTTSVSAGTPAGTNAEIAATLTGAVQRRNDAPTSDTTEQSHTHPAPTFTGNQLAGHDHGPNTLELRSFSKLLYYRR